LPDSKSNEAASPIRRNLVMVSRRREPFVLRDFCEVAAYCRQMAPDIRPIPLFDAPFTQLVYAIFTRPTLNDREVVALAERAHAAVPRYRIPGRRYSARNAEWAAVHYRSELCGCRLALFVQARKSHQGLCRSRVRIAVWWFASGGRDPHRRNPPPSRLRPLLQHFGKRHRAAGWK
jgi:hypothetical protein